jgi:hypothetical protein
MNLNVSVSSRHLNL